VGLAMVGKTNKTSVDVPVGGIWSPNSADKLLLNRGYVVRFRAWVFFFFLFFGGMGRRMDGDIPNPKSARFRRLVRRPYGIRMRVLVAIHLIVRRWIGHGPAWSPQLWVPGADVPTAH